MNRTQELALMERSYELSNRALYVDTWRHMRVYVLSKSTDGQDTTSYCTMIENRQTGVRVPHLFKCGSLHPAPTALQVCSLASVYPMYVFRDGDISHGLEPYDDWCGATEHDPDDASSLIAYSIWLCEAYLAATVMDEMTLSDAYELDDKEQE